MRQEDIFRKSEGTAWLVRNVDKMGKNDLIIPLLKKLGIKPTVAFEVGCSDGWRLKKLKEEFDCKVRGIDPSLIAVDKAIAAGISVNAGTARRLWVSDYTCDLVIYGFCLYVCDRDDLFQIATEGDRVLQDKGYLVIHDFYAEEPHAVPYHHDIRLRTYKMDYARLWLANPAYRLVTQQIINTDDARICVSVLQKNLASAYPLRSLDD